MAGSYTVSLVGFAQNESSTFESFFRLAARRPPSYVVQDEVIDAQILIVNADNPQALHLVRHAELPGRVLLVGNSDGGTGWPLQRKPVKLAAVLAELDALVRGERTSTQASTAVPVKYALPPSRARGGRAFALCPNPAVSKRSGAADEARPGGRPSEPRHRIPAHAAHVPQRAGRRSGGGGVQALARKRAGAVPGCFKKYNLNVDWSREASQAMAMLKAHPYRLVVIDRLSGEPDAFQLCRAAKQQKLLGRPPVVFLFSAVAGSMDRMKAGLAGSDAYLLRSVADGDLCRALAQHRLVDLDGFQKTTVVY